MRTIKFRAWDKKNKKMVMSEDWLMVSGDGEVYAWELGKRYREKNYIPLQFTGLLDKNGKEIFDSDILVVRELHDGHDEYWNQPKGPAIPFIIEWDEKYCSFNVPYDSHYFEVIGNIYENPELLKEKL